MGRVSEKQISGGCAAETGIPVSAMLHPLKILVFIPRTAATEIAVYDGLTQIFYDAIDHVPSELCSLLMPEEQGRYRFNAILSRTEDRGVSMRGVGVVVTHIMCRDLPPGIYMPEARLLRKISANLIDENQYRSGVFTAYFLSGYINDQYNGECLPLVIEPAIGNEISPEAALSGLRGVTREPVYNHFLQRCGATLCAWHELHRRANETQIVVAHLGSEISVGAHDMGRIINSNSPQDGEGPFSPSSCGYLPLDALIEMCYSGKYDMDEILDMISKKSGLSAYLDDASLEGVEKMYRAGDKKTVFLVNAMAYQTAREIGARAAAMNGRVEAIVLTGYWAAFTEFTDEIASYVNWIAPVKIYGAENELRMLAETAVTVYRGDFRILIYGTDRN
ncbi:MAG: butyrate kinase [Synergistaceae bacterium]|jgi:butyrate kinase|nr:butyrate kinase [Synergistaceae bacterium]